jgi:hypothetical protein
MQWCMQKRPAGSGPLTDWNVRPSPDEGAAATPRHTDLGEAEHRQRHSRQTGMDRRLGSAGIRLNGRMSRRQRTAKTTNGGLTGLIGQWTKETVVHGRNRVRRGPFQPVKIGLARSAGARIRSTPVAPDITPRARTTRIQVIWRPALALLIAQRAMHGFGGHTVRGIRTCDESSTPLSQ